MKRPFTPTILFFLLIAGPAFAEPPAPFAWSLPLPLPIPSPIPTLPTAPVVRALGTSLPPTAAALPAGALGCYRTDGETRFEPSTLPLLPWPHRHLDDYFPAHGEYGAIPEAPLPGGEASDGIGPCPTPLAGPAGSPVPGSTLSDANPPIDPGNAPITFTNLTGKVVIDWSGGGLTVKEDGKEVLFKRAYVARITQSMTMLGLPELPRLTKVFKEYRHFGAPFVLVGENTYLVFGFFGLFATEDIRLFHELVKKNIATLYSDGVTVEEKWKSEKLEVTDVVQFPYGPGVIAETVPLPSFRTIVFPELVATQQRYFDAVVKKKTAVYQLYATVSDTEAFSEISVLRAPAVLLAKGLPIGFYPPAPAPDAAAPSSYLGSFPFDRFDCRTVLAWFFGKYGEKRRYTASAKKFERYGAAEAAALDPSLYGAWAPTLLPEQAAHAEFDGNTAYGGPHPFCVVRKTGTWQVMGPDDDGNEKSLFDSNDSDETDGLKAMRDAVAKRGADIIKGTAQRSDFRYLLGAPCFGTFAAPTFDGLRAPVWRVHTVLVKGLSDFSQVTTVPYLPGIDSRLSPAAMKDALDR